MQTKGLSFIAILVIVFVHFSCKKREPTDLTKESIIPKPVSVLATHGAFEVTDQTIIYYQNESDELKNVGDYLSDMLSPLTKTKLPVQSTEQMPTDGHIFFMLEGDESLLGNEGYELTITEQLVTINAFKPEGIFRGIQTLWQILPVDVDEESGLDIPTGNIIDYPEFSYRGSMLDVSRHFFGVEDVKRYIDLITLYRMNIMHLHLSDDQGWRIEIKSWPNLTEHGGSTEVGAGEGGYYTQEEYKEIVQYAKDRYITIVPEIDMPGHTNAALASYPELNCDGKAPELYTGTEVGFSTLCTDKEITYQFVDDVVREISEMTPGPYFHIGGDESHVTPMEDYIPFIERVEEIVNKYGKRMIGWDEIAHADIDSSSVAQVWAKAENGRMAVGQGAKIILSPANKVYLDMKYDSTTKLGYDWAALIEVDSSYLWNAEDLIPGIDKRDILGVEAPLWSETLTNIEEIEYMIFPRLPGIAEVAWSSSSVRDWEDYKIRLGKQADKFKSLEINYYPSPQIPWVTRAEK